MKSKNILIICALCIFTVGVSLFSFKPIKEEPIKLIPKPIQYADTVNLDTFSEANLNCMMQNLEIQCPNVVMAQAKLETGNFKSYFFKVSNNLFGFRNYNGYKRYNNWIASVQDYAKWQDKYYKGGNYYEFLKHMGYAEDTLYIQKLKQFK